MSSDQTPLKFDGFDDALLGLTSRPGQPGLLAYSYDKMVQVLVDRDGMSREDAVEYLDFNTVCAWMGPGTPVIVYDMSMEEIEASLEVDQEPEPGVP